VSSGLTIRPSGTPPRRPRDELLPRAGQRPLNSSVRPHLSLGTPMKPLWIKIAGLNFVCVASLGMIYYFAHDWHIAGGDPVFVGMLIGGAASFTGMSLMPGDSRSVFIMWLVIIILFGLGSLAAGFGSMR
jgi:hypothetical protein